MWRRLTIPVVISLAVTAVLAGAQSRPPDDSREPATTASKALRLPARRHCVQRSVRLTLVPPAAMTFASLSVRIDADEILQLAGLSGPGSLKFVLPSGRSRVRVSGTTSGGQFLHAARTYRRCANVTRNRPTKPTRPKPRPAPTATPNGPPVTGGGED